ncbi:MAG: hypothetical protein JRL30_08340 [Deltaproteobacteria bacterium]|nr:hypothetical protein [Deltaproteobacteria bacterium]
MFTKDDFLNYFNQLHNIEARMHQTYQQISDEITHPTYRKLFNQLAREEAEHMGLVKELKDLLVR